MAEENDGRGKVTDAATDLRVGNKTGEMGKAFRDNPDLAAAAGRKGGEHRHAGDTSPNDELMDEEIVRAQEDESYEEDERYDQDKPHFDSGRVQPAAVVEQHRPYSQKEAVFNAIKEVLGRDRFEGKVEITGKQRQDVRMHIFRQFKEGKVTYGGELPDDNYLRKYSMGLLSNWLRKDLRLNGGERYSPVNSGIRVGSGDEQMKAMQALLNATSDLENRRTIQAEINKRQEFLHRQMLTEINVSALPESLRHLVPRH